MGVQIDTSQGKYEAIILWYVTLSFRYVRPTLYRSSLVLAIRISDLLPLESFPNNVAHLVLGLHVSCQYLEIQNIILRYLIHLFSNFRDLWIRTQ